MNLSERVRLSGKAGPGTHQQPISGLQAHA